MAGETGNSVLELLRGMRADMDERFTAIDERLAGIAERPDAIGTQMEGWRHVFVATTGSLVTDLKNYGTHIAALEGARV